jgi:hypothetical protein
MPATISRTSHAGESAKYDWHSNDEEILEYIKSPEYTSKERMMPLLLKLMKANRDSE